MALAYTIAIVRNNAPAINVEGDSLPDAIANAAMKIETNAQLCRERVLLQLVDKPEGCYTGKGGFPYYPKGKIIARW